MGIFGWSYPTGAASDPFAPYLTKKIRRARRG